MEISDLAQKLVQVLTPTLPLLYDLGKSVKKAAVDATGKKIAGAAWDGVKALWQRLWPKIEEKPAAKEAAADLAAAPDDADRQAALRVQLKKLLESDAGLASDLERGVSVCIQEGERNVYVGGDVKRGVVVTGDHNVIVLSGSAFWRGREPKSTPSKEDLHRATEAYLAYLVERHRYLDFRGFGIHDRVPIRLELLDLFVPLRARPELPPADTLERAAEAASKRAPRRQAEIESPARAERRPLLDLLGEHEGLVILGDPGAGKSTFLKFLALKLAKGEGAGIGLEGKLPVLFPISAYAEALSKQDLPLVDAIRSYLESRGIDAPVGEVFKGALGVGGALVLLDGLDEVHDPALRQRVVDRVVDFYNLERKRGNRFAITSRVVGYRESRPVAEKLGECTLLDFDEEDVEDFAAKWTSALERAAAGVGRIAEIDARREREELLTAVRNNPGVRALSANPLLLTVLALMKRQGITLPERRVELYQRAAEMLLKTWNQARGLERGKGVAIDPVETFRILAPLALWMHETRPGIGRAKRQELLRRIGALLESRGEEKPAPAAERFLEDVRQHAGLLLERGPGEYGFLHLTFEEYLAGVGIAQKGQQSIEPIVEYLAPRLGDPAWREVGRLAIAYLGVIQQRDEAAADVLSGLLDCPEVPPGEAAIFAGEACADAGAGGVPVAARGRAVDALLQAMRAGPEIKAPRRALAGDTLAKLGDPRFREDAWGLPDEPLLGFVEIPEGKFLMGSDAKKDPESRPSEHDQHPVLLPNYYIGRYPVTVAQFRVFVEESNFEPGDKDCLKGDSNHPVVWVSWHEALKYCRWLEEKLRASPKTSEPIATLLRRRSHRLSLPSEAEWEKAARGSDGRIFPWGDDADPEKANYDDTEIGTTSAVGCFHQGKSPHQVEDLAGNVWEWTRSLWGEDWEKPRFKYPYEAQKDRENLQAPDEIHRVLRGGAFLVESGCCRCAFRFRNPPLVRYDDIGFRVALSPA